MLQDFNPDILVAFPGGSGTADCCRKALTKGVKVVYAKWNRGDKMTKTTLKKLLQGKVDLDKCPSIVSMVDEDSCTRGWDGGYFMLYGHRVAVLDDGTCVTYQYSPES
jgi:hypothetical protein